MENDKRPLPRPSGSWEHARQMTSPTTDESCLNCGAGLHGVYCHQCGQRATTSTPGIRDLLHEALHEFLYLDRKILRTVKVLVMEPGKITKDFVDGRRASYISPLRLYLAFSLLFFLVAAVVPSDQGGFIDINTDAPDAESAEEFSDSIRTNLPRVGFLLMPLFAALTLAFYRRRQPYYSAHLIYSLHFHSFTFLLLTFAALMSVAGTTGRVIGAVWVPLTILYHFTALKRLFGERWGRTIWKGLAVGALYWVCLIAAMFLLILVSLGLTYSRI